ncbi:Conserved_hypothetical protein [Hexamita inflata]|uniref:Uncharacterized protein n=1 Tax=Hexamita inflata TaxID=28002 RepID=A0AA86RVU3_9EUKA|nr:Conserved hypothetical protein [Hexamita inflata]
MLISVVLLAGEFPTKVNQYKFNHVTKQDFVTAYSAVLTQHKDQVVQCVSDIKKFHPYIGKYSTTYCGGNKICSAFTQITSLADNDFSIYNSFIEGVIDSMISFHKENNQILGYSLSINSNYPNAQVFYDFLLNNHVEYISEYGNIYTALSVAGFQGYFTFKTEGYAVGMTNDFGAVEELPDYNEQEFLRQVNNNVGQSFCFELLQLVYLNKSTDVVQYLLSQTYSNSFIFGFVDFNKNENIDFYGTKGKYRRQDTLINQVQSSCRYIDSATSDQRITIMEEKLQWWALEMLF